MHTPLANPHACWCWLRLSSDWRERDTSPIFTYIHPHDILPFGIGVHPYTVIGGHAANAVDENTTAKTISAASFFILKLLR